MIHLASNTRARALLLVTAIGCSQAAAPDSGAPDGADPSDGGSGGTDAVPRPPNGALVLNELLAASDDSDDPDDWIELTNTGSETVALAGWALTDLDPTTHDDDPWRFPAEAVVAPGTYIIVWASDPDDPAPDAADFKLSASDGEGLWLLDPSGAVADQVTFPPLDDGQVYARQPDGVGPWAVTDAPSRGAPNP